MGYFQGMNGLDLLEHFALVGLLFLLFNLLRSDYKKKKWNKRNSKIKIYDYRDNK
tara:strand:- start:393 stop:557 length:165 start_codon:yes stop_codon:yes gene_type:complete